MYILLASMIMAVATTFFITPYFIRFLRDAGIVGFDLQKKNRPKLATSGGICVAFGVLAGLLTYIGLQTFIVGLEEWLFPLLAVTSSVLIVMFVGFLDDLNVKLNAEGTIEGRDIRIGLPQWLKPMLTLPAAIPLMAINAGRSTMAIPFVGPIDFGILYPLLLIPLGMVGASNAVNMLAGFNGLEAGMGIVYCLVLGVSALLNNITEGGVVFLVTFAALVGFIWYNRYPAKILPGDSMTYLLGSIVASGVIVGNMERSGLIVMLPFIIEFFLKLRVRFKASCLGKLREDGKLDPPYGKKIYSWTHLIMNLKPLTEKQVTIILILIQVFFSILILLPFVFPSLPF
jgi:UDP-N-acetylglucosamine--dolichyl-phosphate N-acetylglucosaminephosphotransferase